MATNDENLIDAQAHIMGLMGRVHLLENQVKDNVTGPQLLERVQILETHVKDLIDELIEADVIEKGDEDDEDDDED